MIPGPNRRFLLILFFPLAVIVLGFIYPPFFQYSILINVLIFAFGGIDVVFSLKKLDIDFSIEKNKLFSIGRENSIHVHVINKSKAPIMVEIKLAIPEFIEDKSEVLTLKMPPRSEDSLTFKVRPIRRGSFIVPELYFRVLSGFGWFYIYGSKKIETEIEVFPDIEKLNHFLKLTRRDRVDELGIHRNRWKGLGTELESLREYQMDDDSKYIDWKASTRLNKPVTKVFQMETNNHIAIAIDCGRLMTAEQNGLNTLDHAVNSLLILSHIAFRMGDSISVIAFSDRIIGELPESKGKVSLRKMTGFITKLEPEYVESNYTHAFQYLQKKVKKRSLVIFLTDMIDDINYINFKTGLTRLSKKHLVLFILLRDVLLTHHTDQHIKNVDDLFTTTAAKEMFLRRDQAISKLKHQKVNIIDVLPHLLTGNLINKYLELKAQNRI